MKRKTNLIPTSVVKFLMKFEEEDLSEALSYFIRSIDGDDYYFKDLLVNDEFINEALGEELYKISQTLSYKQVFEWFELLKGENE